MTCIELCVLCSITRTCVMLLQVFNYTNLRAQSCYITYIWIQIQFSFKCKTVTHFMHAIHTQTACTIYVCIACMVLSLLLTATFSHLSQVPLSHVSINKEPYSHPKIWLDVRVHGMSCACVLLIYWWCVKYIETTIQNIL